MVPSFFDTEPYLSGSVYENTLGIDDKELHDQITNFFKKSSFKRILLLPPDLTRMDSGAGKIVNMIYNILEPDCHVDIMPALGTHVPMTRDEQILFFGADIPKERYLVHNWRNNVEKIGEIPAEFVSKVSEGISSESIDVEISSHILHGDYELVVSIGQVVPHEVVGMANYTKNVVVGCGGESMINNSHMIGALYGLEKLLGVDGSPVRQIFDYAEVNFLQDISLLYILTVTTTNKDATNINGLYMGRSRKLFEKAVSLSQKLNITKLSEPIETCIVYLDEREFHSTWLGNKAIYRTRKAMAKGGRLFVLAKGVVRFGEDAEIDRLIRKYGYIGRKGVLDLLKSDEVLKENLSVAAHLIHGSSDGNFDIIYCVDKMTKQEIEGVNFEFATYNEVIKKYPIDNLNDGWNIIDGEKVYYISNPALGLWDLA